MLTRDSRLSTAVLIGCTGNSETAGMLFMEAGADLVWAKPPPRPAEMVAQICQVREKKLGRVASFPGQQCLNVLLLMPLSELSASSLSNCHHHHHDHHHHGPLVDSLHSALCV